MKPDASLLLYEKFFAHKNCELEIYLKNQTKITGSIVGYFYGNPDSKDSFIIKWHIATQATFINTDAIGTFIHNSEILRVHCLSDNSVIEFDTD